MALAAPPVGKLPDVGADLPLDGSDWLVPVGPPQGLGKGSRFSCPCCGFCSGKIKFS